MQDLSGRRGELSVISVRLDLDCASGTEYFEPVVASSEG